MTHPTDDGDPLSPDHRGAVGGGAPIGQAFDGLIARLEAASEGSRELDILIHAHIHCRFDLWTENNGSIFDVPGRYFYKQAGELRFSDTSCYTTSLDAALTLVPDSACNYNLRSFVGHGIETEGFPDTAWSFRFHDTAQLKGMARAMEESAGMRARLGDDFDRWIAVIATQFREFSGDYGATPALAVCIAALRARAAPAQPPGEG